MATILETINQVLTYENEPERQRELLKNTFELTEEQVAAIMRAIESIPEDYTELVSVVEGLVSSYGALENTVDGLTENVGDITDDLENKADKTGTYENLTAGKADQLKFTVYKEDKTPYLFRTSAGSADIGNQEENIIVGGTVCWNQIVNTNDITVNVPINHKYYASINGKKTIEKSTASAISISNASSDNVTDLTLMFGNDIAEIAYIKEQLSAGSGVAWLKSMGFFTKDFYPYEAGELKSVEGLIAHVSVGFNAYAHSTGKAHVVGGKKYQITGEYTSLSMNGETITPINGFFTPDISGEITVTGGNLTDTCIHLVWSGYRNGEYQHHIKYLYPLDKNIILRGIPKLDEFKKLYFDGDIYYPTGRVERRYNIVDLGNITTWYYTAGGNGRFNLFICNMINESAALPNIKNETNNALMKGYTLHPDKATTPITIAGDKLFSISNGFIFITDNSFNNIADFKRAISGVKLVYELETPTIESAEPYTTQQNVDDFGTEEYVISSDVTVPVPVGHVTKYPANLRDKLQHLPDLADDDGYYLIQQIGADMDLVAFRIPRAPEIDGTYTLKCAVSGGTPTYEWESIT